MLQFQLLEPIVRLSVLLVQPGEGEGERKGSILFALGMEIYPTNFTFDMVEANVVEPLEAGACDCPDTMIGD
jgi:hypothetical protein